MMLSLLASLAFFASSPLEIRVSVEVPQIEARPYHKPYVAVWLETLDREGVTSLAVWHEKDDWLKDLRQWWRKLGRSGPAYDAISGATRQPGIYNLVWNGQTPSLKGLKPGAYYLNVEAAREQGGRDFVRQKIEIGAGAQTYRLKGELELGTIIIEIGGSHE